MGDASAPRTGEEKPTPDLKLVLALMLVGLVLRASLLPDLGWNVDEGMFVVDASKSSLSEVWQSHLSNPHPFANAFLLHLLLRISWSPLLLKLAALLAGTLLIPLGWLFARELLGRVAGLSMAVFITFSPQLIALSAVCRNYAPGFALLMASLYFMARFLRRGDSRDLLYFGLFELLASAWFYMFVIAFLGVNAVLAGVLLRRRASRAVWTRAIGAQLPVAAFYLVCFAVHLEPHILPRADGHVNHVFAEQLSLAPRGDWLPVLQGLAAPIMGVLRYLVEGLAPLFLVLVLLGVVGLMVERRWSELALLLAPLPFAYAFLLILHFPLGEIRQSAYLHPFLLGLAVAPLQLASSLRLPLSARLRQGLVFAIVALLGVGLLVSHLRGIPTQDGLITGMTRLTGFETSTRISDLDQAVAALHDVSEPGDVVLVTYQSLLALSLHVDHGPQELDYRRPVYVDAGGVRLIYSPTLSYSFSAGRFLDALRELESGGETVAGRVCVPHTGWELYSPSLVETLQAVYPELPSSAAWLREFRNAAGQVHLSCVDATGARKLERLSDEEEEARFIAYVLKRIARSGET